MGTIGIRLEDLPLRAQQQALAQLKTAQIQKARKYRNEPEMAEGIRFDSKKEAGRFRELQAMLQAGLIRELRLQQDFTLQEAYPEVFDSLYKVGADTLTGVFHSFTGNEAELEEIKKLNNFKIGINGVITFKNSRLSEIIRQTDIRKIVLETDAPYLAPVPYRGKRNEPAYIWKTAEKVAQTYGLTLEETVETTRINALKLFKIENKPIS